MQSANANVQSQSAAERTSDLFSLSKERHKSVHDGHGGTVSRGSAFNIHESGTSGLSIAQMEPR